MSQLTIPQAYQIAVKKYREGNFADAAHICRQILGFNQDHEATLTLMGLIEGGRSNDRQALSFFKRALALNPRSPQLESNIGEAHRRLGESELAKSAFQGALKQKPHFAPALNGLGMLYRHQGELEAALSSFRKAVAGDPRHADSLRNLGAALLESRQFEEAADTFKRLEDLGRADLSVRLMLGTALTGLGRIEDAITIFEKALQTNPQSSKAHENLASLLLRGGNAADAIAHYQAAVSIDPKNATAHSNLGNALAKCGLVDDALEHYRLALATAPSLREAWHGLLYYQQYSIRETEETIAESFAQWRKHVVKSIPMCSSNSSTSRPAGSRLRVGYVSPDFRNHVMGQFILPILQGHDPNDFEVFAYSEVTREDHVTEQCRKAAHHWRVTAGRSDEEVLEMIQQDAIDILVDLAMHSTGNRLLLFARKAAPIQITYLANIYTTGLETVDYRLGDPILDPEGWSDPSYTEETIRLPRAHWCYTPTSTPAISESPFLASRHITFACLNNYCKVNPEVLAIWAEILRRVPRSRLLLLAPEGPAQSRTIDTMQTLGIPADRLELVTRIPPSDYLETYNRIDICLDPFPYQGITTTLDALWMGCPVVSFAGTRGVERVALSMLTSVGHSELVGSDLDDYTRIAVELARDPQRLSHLRSSLREKLRTSPLMDLPNFMRDLENVYRLVWRRAVDKSS